MYFHRSRSDYALDNNNGPLEKIFGSAICGGRSSQKRSKRSIKMAREDFILSHQSFRNGKYADGRLVVDIPPSSRMVRKKRKSKRNRKDKNDNDEWEFEIVGE